MINYLIELAIIHLVFFAGYWLFLRKEHQYGTMRAYLLISTLMSIIIPLLQLPQLFLGNVLVSGGAVSVLELEVLPLEGVVITASTPWWTWSTLLTLGYLVVSAGLMLHLIKGILYLIRIERTSRYEKFMTTYIRRTGKIKSSFSFFNWIFVSDEIDRDDPDYDVIVKHESAHALLGHSYDVLFFRLFKIVFWWLPSAWLIEKEIKKIHEYQADAYALKSCGIDLYSSILISSTLKSNGLSMASSFHDGLIQKRLIAMKQQVKKIRPWKLGTLSALCSLLFIGFACTEEPDSSSTDGTPTAEQEVFTKVEEQPEFKGGMTAFYEYIKSEMTYPKQARKIGVEGKVYVQFVVERDGSVTNVEALKGIGAGCDAEAVRVISQSPAFKPGSQRGRTVRTQLVVPIEFRLTDSSIDVDKVESNSGQLKADASYSNGEWSGTIYSPEGKPLPGVNVVVAGTNRGTVSDLDGTFKVKADASKELHLSFVGYTSVKLKSN